MDDNFYTEYCFDEISCLMSEHDENMCDATTMILINPLDMQDIRLSDFPITTMFILDETVDRNKALFINNTKMKRIFYKSWNNAPGVIRGTMQI